MQNQPSKSFHWPDILVALRACTGDLVRMRSGTAAEPAGEVRSRAAARGTELCLFEGSQPFKRAALIEQLEALAGRPGRHFMAAARIHVDGGYHLVERVADEDVDGMMYATIVARRSTTGFEPGRGKAPHTTGRSKRIKTG
ncbi:MAG: hypothetical protein ACYDGM_11025 [Vulcanimicrobiaceae bacterium]